MRTLSISTDDGDVTITEDELPTITGKELEYLHISRAELHRCFAEAAALMENYTPADCVRLIASKTLDGKWEVRIFRYSPANDPSMH
jgi:hypothetical protein